MRKLTALIFTLIFVLSFVLATSTYGQNDNSSFSDGNRSPFASSKEGDVVLFAGENWRVLEVHDGKALILSDKVLTSGIYHKSITNKTWEDSEIREFLNGQFYDDAFSENEKTWITDSAITNLDNPWYGTSGGVSTIDRVFLLSLEEVIKYFGDSGRLSKQDKSGFINDKFNSTRIANDKNSGKPSRWWLRTRGRGSNYAVTVAINGRVGVNGDIINVGAGVRPALWVKM